MDKPFCCTRVLLGSVTVLLLSGTAASLNFGRSENDIDDEGKNENNSALFCRTGTCQPAA